MQIQVPAQMEDSPEAKIELENVDKDKDVGDMFFLERIGDGYVFACGEREAWNTLSNRSNWQRSDFRVIGTSNGAVFRDMVAKSRDEKLRIKNELTNLRSQLDKYTKTEEKFLYEELLDPNDPKVVRVRELIDGIYSQMEPIEKRLKDYSRLIVEEAWKAELEIAKKTPRIPKSFRVDTPGGDRDKILRMLGQ